MEYQSDDAGIIGKGKVQRITKKGRRALAFTHLQEQSRAEQLLPLRAAFRKRHRKNGRVVESPTYAALGFPLRLGFD
jgi:hypothetical protein